MGLMEEATGTKIHMRQILLSTYPARNNCIIVEGVLKDDRAVGVYLSTGRKKPPGTIHHMIVRMLIGPPGLAIQDIEVEMPEHPRPECTATRKSLDRLKNLQIQSGYSAKVKQLIGGNKGCAHLNNLVTAMAQEAVQGYYSFIAQNPSDSGSKKFKKGVEAFLSDTCYVWRKDGPLMQKLNDELKKKSNNQNLPDDK